jgi:zinc and cadmium transporter
MPSTLINILIAVLIVSLVSILGILIFLRKKILNKILLLLVGFAAGSLLGAAFIDLLPEVVENGFSEITPIIILAGILFFFILEKFMHWHHHHTHEKETHSFTYLNIIGDAVHNFLDGAVIAVAFINSTALGIVTTIAIIAHEIPQEISDFAILIYGGFSKTKALVYNFITALTAVLGALVAFFYNDIIESSETVFLSLAIGFFIYIAATDLIPEIQKEKDIKKSSMQLLMLILGIFVIWFVGYALSHFSA